jgi:hypothetical protein
MNKFANDAFYFVGIENIYYANSTYGAISGISPFNVASAGGYAVIQGRNFSNTVTVLIDGSSAPAVSVVSNTTINVQIPAKTNGSYDVYVINSDGTFALRPGGLTYIDYPVWITNSPLPSTVYNSSYSTQLESIGGTITYNVTDGSSLPAWLTLSSNGLLTSTSNPPNDNNNTFTFSIDAYTPASNSRVSRQFTIFSSNNLIEMMLVAGGGAGHSQGGGGGGGGMLLYTSNTAVSLKTPNGNSFTVSVNTALVVNVGSGGVASGTTATRGGNTTVVGGGLNYSAFGGGSGASRDYASPNVAGGSGGGGGSGAAGGSNAGGAGTAGQGFNGADGTNSTSGGGGGGGASQAGFSGGNYLGRGGDGHAVNFDGTSPYFAGGGGAGGTGGFAGGGGAGGLGGGGGGAHGIVGGGGSTGGTLSTNAAFGTYGQGRVNSGGGGGGGASSYNGGSGIVVMRHSRQYPPANVSGGAFTSNTDNYFRWYNITANCTITFYNLGEPQWLSSPLITGSNNATFSLQLSANGANFYSLDTGSTLPDWLTLYSNGLLYSAQVNVATIPSSFNFTVAANNAANLIAKRDFTLTIASYDLLITPNTNGTGVRGWNKTDGALTFSTPNTYTLQSQSNFNLVVDLKGAGGGSGVSAGYLGGAGGRAQGTIAMVSGRTYKLVVGGSNITNAYTPSPYGGGGTGGSGAGAFGGAGGGYTGIFVTDISHSNSVIIAAGGGGGPGNDVASTNGVGGQGGGTSGQAGTGTQGAGGGTQLAGGERYSSSGTDGSALQGGTGGTRGGNQGGGGGGGGGFYGGGGGERGGFGSSGQTGSGGGGGSSYTGGHSNAVTSSTSTTQGGGAAAAANGSAIFS